MKQQNLCKPCGIWSQCERSFTRFLDQAHCRFAVKAEHRDQCMHHRETGQCDSLEAQTEARNEKNKSVGN